MQTQLDTAIKVIPLGENLELEASDFKIRPNFPL